MHYPVTRFPDSLVLTKFVNTANKLSKTNWQLTVTGQNHQLFTVTIPAGGKKPWEGNAVAKEMAASSGVAGRSFTLIVDGQNVAQFNRQDNNPSDLVLIEQGWYGSSDASHLRYVECCGAVSAEFGLTGPAGRLPTGLSDELGRFVETRDQGLARLEELYSRFTQNVLEERERMAADLQARIVGLDHETQNKRALLEQQFTAKETALGQRETALGERLKQIDDRGAKHARRALRNDIITELNKRETTSRRAT